MRQLGVAGALAVGLWSAPSRALGGHLVWARSAGAADCPVAVEIEADVARRLGWSPFPGVVGVPQRLVDTTVEVLVSHDAGSYRAQIEMRAADGASLGSRSVESAAPSCASLASAVALSIALLFEPLAREAVPVTEPQPAPVATRPVVPAPRPTPPVATRDSAAVVGASVAAMGTVAVLPRLAAGVLLASGVRFSPAWSARARLGFLPEQRVSNNGADAGLSAALGMLGACYRPLASRHVALESCAGLTLTALSLAVYSPTPVAPGERWSGGANAGMRLSVQQGALEFEAGLDALVPFARREFLVSHVDADPSVVFTQPALGALASLGLGARY